MRISIFNILHKTQIKNDLPFSVRYKSVCVPLGTNNSQNLYALGKLAKCKIFFQFL